jgi:uncharacterized protein with von Willebrand factor type A (vWA) domain
MSEEARAGPASLAHRLVAFCRLLRDRGLEVTPGRALDAGRSLALVDVTDRESFRAALRANLTISVEEYGEFERAFHEFWGPGGAAAQAAGRREQAPVARAVAAASVYEQRGASGAAGGEESARLPGGEGSASDRDVLTHKDFAEFDAGEMKRARRLIRQAAPELATVPSRRTRPAPSGAVDLRRTVRAARSSGGEALRLLRQERKRQRLRVVALCDVSGSMDLYSNYLLQFLYALQQESGGVRTFVFSTRLQDVTAALRSKTYDEALEGMERAARAWSGGTSIGGCLAEFNRRYGAALVGPRTVVIVASDGWERGDPGQLAREMAVLQRRAYRVIWLNPLRGQEGYRPLARGMAAALPYIDHFLPAHNIAALESLRGVLARG